jgi:hypothetical protein
MLPSVTLPGQQQQPGSSRDFKIQTGAADIKLCDRRELTQYERSAWIPRIEQASKETANFLRHGAADPKFNIHSPDGYVRVAVLIQLPQFRQWNIDDKILEVILMHGRQRLMLNSDKTKIRAIQGHTLEKFDYDLLYERIISIPFFNKWPGWGGNTPNMAVVEITNDPVLDHWKRTGLYKPSIQKRIHTMKAVVGTIQMDFGTANITMYAYVRMKDLLEFKPKVEMYITPNGRIVTQHALPWTAVEMIRRNHDGSIINRANTKGSCG